VNFLVLMGDLVRSSATGEWKTFGQDWSLAISGSELPQTGTLRTRVIPVAGEHDRIGDDRLVGFGAAFPGVGADIGYNRVATWYRFDVAEKGARWRILVLDSDKAELGSRWDEQMAWIPKALESKEQDYDGLLVFMHHPPRTLAKNGEPDLGGAPSELLETVEMSTPINRLKAVFSAHSNTDEVYLPGGKYGELYVVAGGGGAPADTLRRWGKVGDNDWKLEPIFDLALLREFDRWNKAKEIPEAIRDKAKATGTWQGFDAELDPRYFPVQGWWNVTLDGPDMSASFRMVGPDGALKDVYAVDYDHKAGWKIGG
jgi:hypothetical protein